MIKLLAVAPSGEVFFTRDQHGQVWEHRRLGLLDPIQVGEQVVDRVVLDHGYERVDEDAETWGDVEDLVERRIRRIEKHDLPVNRVVAQSMLPVIDNWLASSADRHLVVPLVTRLLEEDTVAGDATLRRQLLERVQRASAPADQPLARTLAAAGTQRTQDRYDVVRRWFEAAA